MPRDEGCRHGSTAIAFLLLSASFLGLLLIPTTSSAPQPMGIEEPPLLPEAPYDSDPDDPPFPIDEIEYDPGSPDD